MPEIHATFTSKTDWETWSTRHTDINAIRKQIVKDVQRYGLREPFTNIRRPPFDVVINHDDLHESISSYELNSRKRALLLQIERTLLRMDWLHRRRLRILSADGISRLALILRGHFPYFLGTEFLPSEHDRNAFFPIPHMDLHDITYADESFDLFVSGDVFEHVANLDKALAEIYRVLAPGGILISSFPFSTERYTTEIRAHITPDGQIQHLLEPQYHKNPVDSTNGSLVFSLPGWDILDKLRDLGFSDARFNLTASSIFGIASQSTIGPFVLVATKATSGAKPLAAPTNSILRAPMPRQVVTLFGPPRSGTTLLASILAVNGAVEAVYEPWNSKQLPLDRGLELEDFLMRLGLENVRNRCLLVKETSTDKAFIENTIQLVRSVPHPIRVHPIVILRHPLHTFLSEIRRRNEWWNSPVKLCQESFDQWCAKTRGPLERMLGFIRSRKGTVLSLEALSNTPERVIRYVCDRTDLEFDPRQLEYQKYLDTSKVRGDKNIQSAAAGISSTLVDTNQEQLEIVENFMANSPYNDWVQEFKRIWIDAFPTGPEF